MKKLKILAIALIPFTILFVAYAIQLVGEYQTLLTYLDLESHPWFIEQRISEVGTLLALSIISASMLSIASAVLLFLVTKRKK